MAYIDTFYRRTLAEAEVRSALSGPEDCDTVIVGAGIAGLTTALQLARAGQSVVVVEAESVGFGASGRNGGFVGPGFAADDTAILRRAGPDIAHRLHLMSIEGMDFVHDAIRDLSINGVAPCTGILHALRHDDSAALTDYAGSMARHYDYELEYIDRARLRTVLKSRRYFQALRDGRAFHMHPLNYLRGLGLEIERLGGRIFERSAAIACDSSAAQKTIRTRCGQVRARDVVFATGGYTGNLEPRLKRAQLPIASYVMLSEQAPELIRSAIATTDATGDNRRAGDYYRVVDDGKRLLWGGRITTRPAPPTAVAKELRRQMIGTYPQLSALKIELAWSGLMSYARHRMPQLGKLQPNVWHCTAFGGHGLNTASIGGKVVAEGILGQSDRYTAFASFGLDWTGGAVGMLAAQLTYWKLQAEDWWRERAA